MKEYLKKISLVLATCTFLFSCDKFLEENPKDKLPEDDVYNSISEVYLNAVASLYTYVGGYSDSQGLQGTGRGVYDLNTFTTDEAIIPTRGGDWYDGGFWQGLFLHDWGIENDAIQATWEYLYKVAAGIAARYRPSQATQPKSSFVNYLPALAAASSMEILDAASFRPSRSSSDISTSSSSV